jgi:hypothetical protein
MNNTPLKWRPLPEDCPPDGMHCIRLKDNEDTHYSLWQIKDGIVSTSARGFLEELSWGDFRATSPSFGHLEWSILGPLPE